MVRGDKVDEFIKVRSFYIISASVPAGEWCGGVGFIVISKYCSISFRVIILVRILG